jgi:uncharacterized membrane protein YqhA
LQDAAPFAAHGCQMIRRLFESILWNSRFLTLIAVVGSMIGALMLFFIAALGVTELFGAIGQYSSHALTAAEHHAVRARIIANVAEFVDEFLFAIVLIIFALGLYELFIGPVKDVENSELVEGAFVIRSFDDLAEKLAKVIFLILIVRYFEYALDTEISSSRDLLSLAAGIVFIAIAIWFMRPRDKA